MKNFFTRRRRKEADERAKMERLEKAETELMSLKVRAARAIQLLDARRNRNHWRESVEQMIRGNH